MALFTVTHSSVRLSSRRFFPVQFAGKDVETSRAFSTESYVPADLLLLFKDEVSLVRRFRYRYAIDTKINFTIDRL